MDLFNITAVFFNVLVKPELSKLSSFFYIMNIIFVKMAHDPSRTFYAQAYKEGEKVSPACWSSDSKKPFD